MSFTYPSLFFVWLVPLVALPVLIHLINLLRHRRVKWAAMDFLLESKKKNQNWIRLKQLLLLLARMTIIAAIVWMLAGPMLRDKWTELFGGGKTHHIVLLDDSGSMTDRWSTTSSFARAKDVVQNIAVRAGRQASQHSITLLRFSDAEAGKPPEIIRQPITEKLEADYERLQESLAATPLGVGPLAALEMIERTVKREEDENSIVYVVSDLRTRDWQEPGPLRQVLERMTGNGAQLHLVHCVEEARPNLAITHLSPSPGQQAVGVSIRMDVEVTNYGDQTVTNVPVQLQQAVYVGAEDVEGEIGSLGAEKFDQIDAGQSVVRSFDVNFSTPGSHEIRASLPSDAIALDNQRYCVIEVAQEVPVLIVDDGGEDDAIFLRLALAPSPRIKTGVRARIERSTYLRDNSLERYHTICLLNIEKLDQQEIDRLEAYVRGGGGVMFFTGNKFRREFANKSLYRQGKGLFPLPLSAPTTLLVDRLEKAPDIQIQSDHPIFSRTFRGIRNSFLQSIAVQRYYAAANNWSASADPAVSVVASLRNGSPLIVERKFGDGRVLAVLTTAAPIWNNWGRDPSFAIWLLESQVYLGSRKVQQSLHQVGEPLQLRLAIDFQPDVDFIVPAEPTQRVIQAHATLEEGSETGQFVLLNDVMQSGVYEARLTRMDGDKETRRFAYNAVETESDLRIVDQGELRLLLKDVPFEYRNASEFLAPVTQQAGFPVAEQWWFFLLLVSVLVVEQLLAYSASYHPPLQTRGRRR